MRDCPPRGISPPSRWRRPRPLERVNGSSMAAARVDGFLPIADDATIGDGQTVALVDLNGAIDWLCLRTWIRRRSFGALLDAERGGRFVGRARRSVPISAPLSVANSNVLETTFSHGGGGRCGVTDTMTLPQPSRALSRSASWSASSKASAGSSAQVVWSVVPRFDFGRCK